jgi:hypothetical protein
MHICCSAAGWRGAQPFPPWPAACRAAPGGLRLRRKGRYCAATEAVPPQGSGEMGKAMRILALLGVLAAAYFAYRYGVR